MCIFGGCKKKICQLGSQKLKIKRHFRTDTYTRPYKICHWNSIVLPEKLGICFIVCCLIMSVFV